jgi:hypothetical protein
VKFTAPDCDGFGENEGTEQYVDEEGDNHDPEEAGSMLAGCISSATATQPSKVDDISKHDGPMGLLSICEQEVTGEQTFKGIARATKSALECGRFFSIDPHDTSTLEFWLRSFVSHLRAVHAKFASSKTAELCERSGASSQVTLRFGDSQPPHVQAYLKYVVKCLLGSACYQVLGHFTKHFMDIKEFAPELVPQVALAFEMLQKEWRAHNTGTSFHFQPTGTPLSHTGTPNSRPLTPECDPLVHHYSTTNWPLSNHYRPLIPGKSH